MRDPEHNGAEYEPEGGTSEPDDAPPKGTPQPAHRAKDAEGEARRAVELAPDNADYHHTLARILGQTEQSEDAEGEARRAVELAPDNADYHHTLARILGQWGRLEDAEGEARRAVELAPENADYHDTLARILGQTEQFELAVAEARRAVELAPENADYHDTLAHILRQTGQLDEAEEVTRRAAEAEAEARVVQPSTRRRQDDGLTDQVEWVPDSPATRDLLSREHLARALTDRLRRLRSDEPDRSFLIHIDGPWSSGKTTFLELVNRKLTDDCLVVRFDAWRQSLVGPPWWSLLMALRRVLAAETGFPGRISLRLGEARERIRRGGMPYLVSLMVLIAVVVGLLLLFRPRLAPSAAGDFARSITAVLAAFATLWLGTRLLGKLLFWDSAAGARLFEQAHENPMESLADHFAWLILKARRPVVFVVDDLDRCDKDYVVDLLDAVQTLIRDVPERQRRKTRCPRLAPYFLVAADGAWIRRSYEVRHEPFEKEVGTPGRPLGYLFLDKIFQLTVDVPSISPEAQRSFLARLLRAETLGSEDLVHQAAATSEEINRSFSETEVLEALQRARPEVRSRVAGSAVERLTRPEVERATEHALQKFAPLLEPNPRAIKRFVNAYGMARASSVLAGRVAPRDTLALWTILRLRWPGFADYLRSNPQTLDAIAHGQGPPADGREDLAPLFTDPSVVTVVTFPSGGPLTQEHVRLCAGMADTLATHDS